MNYSLLTDAQPMAGIKEKYDGIIQKQSATSLTLYDLLERLPLDKFRDMLGEAGVLDLLKQAGKITLLAPVNAAFESIDPLLAGELQGENRLRRIQTLARSHIIAGRTLFRRSDGYAAPNPSPIPHESVLEGNSDFNGDEIQLNVDVTYQFGREFLGRSHKEYRYLVHMINGVAPLEPFPQGSLRASNGTIILVPALIVGKTFLEQKYDSINERAFPGGDGRGATLWENLQKLKLTTFCNAIRQAGLEKLLDSPPPGRPEDLQAFVPVDEAFENVVNLASLETPAGAEAFVKRHLFAKNHENLAGERLPNIGSPQEFIGRFHADVLYFPAPKFRASNARFYLFTKSFLSRRVHSWNLEPVVYA